MILNVIALLVLVAAVVIGLNILRDRLGRVRENVHPVCANCNTPAEALVSFTCPGCGQDVRERGLVVPQANSPLALFWRAVALSLMVTIAAAVAYLLGNALLPRVTH